MKAKLFKALLMMPLALLIAACDGPSNVPDSGTGTGNDKDTTEVPVEQWVSIEDIKTFFPVKVGQMYYYGAKRPEGLMEICEVVDITIDEKEPSMIVVFDLYNSDSTIKNKITVTLSCKDGKTFKATYDCQYNEAIQHMYPDVNGSAEEEIQTKGALPGKMTIPTSAGNLTLAVIEAGKGLTYFRCFANSDSDGYEMVFVTVQDPQ